MRWRTSCSSQTATQVVGAVVLAAALLGGSALARPTDVTGSAGQLRHDASALVAAGAPGVVVVSRRGAHIVRFASGVADVRNNEPMRPQDRFRIGSLTKTFVATVALQLVAEGRLALTDTVARWLPGVVPNGEHITIRELLNHSSGIPEFDTDPRVLQPYLSGHLGYHWAPRALVKIAFSHHARFAPGKGYFYSNTNYLLTGMIIEAVTRESLVRELVKRIFRPLHLTSTSFQTKPGLVSPYAHGYYVFKKPAATDISGLSPYPWAAGAIVSTGRDVAIFYRTLLRGRLLPVRELREMETTISEGAHSDLPGSRYGLGLESFRLPCGQAWGHGGNFPGYLVFSLSSRNGNRQAVVLVNEDPSSLPNRAGPQFFKLVADAYCQSGAS
jgi:D-alanyl-D-alanine carboxypeptidase